MNKTEEKKDRRRLRRYQRRKIRCLFLLGGKCQRCQYDDSPAALEFHHENPKEKKYEISYVLYTMNDLDFENYGIDEIKKCELLCANCHAIEHRGLSWPLDMWVMA